MLAGNVVNLSIVNQKNIIMLSEKKKLEMFLQYKELKAAAAAAVEAAKKAEEALIKAMVLVPVQDKDGKTINQKQLLIQGKKVAWVVVTAESEKLDEKRLQTEAPDIWEQFKKKVKGQERFYCDKK